MTDLRRLAVHDALGSHDLTAIDRPDALVAETNAEYRHAPLSELSYRRVRDTGLLRASRTGRDQHRIGIDGLQLLEPERVVAVHERLRAELTEILHEVVDERVVVIHYQHARGHRGTVSERPGARLRYPL